MIILVTLRVSLSKARESADRQKTQLIVATAVRRALRLSARVARKTARLHATPVYIWRDSKVVAERP